MEDIYRDPTVVFVKGSSKERSRLIRFLLGMPSRSSRYSKDFNRGLCFHEFEHINKYAYSYLPEMYIHHAYSMKILNNYLQSLGNSPLCNYLIVDINCMQMLKDSDLLDNLKKYNIWVFIAISNANLISTLMGNRIHYIFTFDELDRIPEDGNLNLNSYKNIDNLDDEDEEDEGNSTTSLYNPMYGADCTLYIVDWVDDRYVFAKKK
jgi:hypothetical protein